MGSLKKKANVVMLSTKKTNSKNSIITYSEISSGCEQSGWYSELRLKNEQRLGDFSWYIIKNPHHLYITSDDEIKEGDWFIKMNHKGGKPTLYQESKKAFMNSEWLNSSDVNDCFKIITTTDKSLGLPEPSPAFIQKYISDHNKGNIITEVMVEYLQYSDEELYKITELKVDSNNCITITKVKDSYSREEVKQLLLDCCGEVSASDGKLLGKTPVELYKWIEENL
jgi:hypothetical protein